MTQYQYTEKEKAPWDREIEFQLTQEDALSFADVLDRLISKKKREIRMPLPDTPNGINTGGKESWYFFWKLGPGDTRAMLAHPSNHEWVASVAFNPQHLEKIIVALRAGQSTDLQSTGKIQKLGNNIHVVFNISA